MTRYLLLAAVAVFCLSLFLVITHAPTPSPEGAEPFVRSGEFHSTFALESMRWFNDQRAFPAGTIPLDWRTKALAQIEQSNLRKTASASSISWSFLGPDNIGGRIRSVVVHPTNSNILFCGSVSGGIWKSTDAGASWIVANDFMPNLVISSIVIDPTNANIMYAGTGEGFFNSDALRGVGVLKSTDGGSTWAALSSFSGSPAGFPYYVNDLYIRPDLSSTIYAATNQGVFRTTNSGSTWTYIKRGDNTYRATQIVASATAPQTFYVAFGNFSRDGIYETTNGGTAWTKLAGGFPTSGFNRISMGISKSNPLVLYAVLTDSATYGTKAIERSSDGGATWTAVVAPTDAGGGTHLGTQGWYDNVVAVHPTNENIVYIGGINSFKSVSGGATWTQITSGYSPFIHPYMHVDQHAMALDPNNAQVVYFGNDGGMYKSTDGGGSFTNANAGLAVTQFYSGAVHPTLDIFYGGTQDNGTLKGTGTLSWVSVFSGDGGVTRIDPTTPTTVYTEYTFLDIQKSTNSGALWAKSINGIPTSGSGQGSGASERCNFIAPYAMDPSNSQVLVAGTYKAYRTTNGGVLWAAISGDLTGSGAGATTDPGAVISAIAIAKSGGDTIYVGTSGFDTLAAAPKVQVTANKGVSWTDVTKSPLPKRYITSIAVDPANASRAFVGFSGYNANSSLPGHVFRTTNRGTSWTNVTGDLIDIPVNSIVLDPSNANHMAVGTDLGVFETANGGTNWLQQNTGLANVSIAELELRGDGFLFATSHGRGMYRSVAVWTTTGVTELPAELPSAFVLQQNYPNPFNPTTTIPFTVPSRAAVRLTVYDAVGREVALLVNEELSPGTYSATFDASSLASGVYFYRMTAANQGAVAGPALYSEAKKMVLVR